MDINNKPEGVKDCGLSHWEQGGARLERQAEKNRRTGWFPLTWTSWSYLWHIHRRRTVFGFGAGICSGTGRCAGPCCVSLSKRCSTAASSSHSETPPLAPDLWPYLTGKPRTAPSDPWPTEVKRFAGGKHSAVLWALSHSAQIIMWRHYLFIFKKKIKPCTQVKYQTDDLRKDVSVNNPNGGVAATVWTLSKFVDATTCNIKQNVELCRL